MANNRNYLITGATGKVGKRVAEQLLSQGHQVRVFGRNRDTLEPLVDMGATPFVGDMRDQESVSEAFRGVDAALLVAQGDRSSHDYRRDFARAGENYATALARHGVKWAVFVSALGADDDRNHLFVAWHAGPVPGFSEDGAWFFQRRHLQPRDPVQRRRHRWCAGDRALLRPPWPPVRHHSGVGHLFALHSAMGLRIHDRFAGPWFVRYAVWCSGSLWGDSCALE